jgi:hypothetical protein
MMPLDEQEKRYEENFEHALAELLRDLQSAEYRNYIFALGLQRLRDGFDIFGDEMYSWHPAVRECAEDEELADLLVYKTSGS